MEAIVLGTAAGIRFEGNIDAVNLGDVTLRHTNSVKRLCVKIDLTLLFNEQVNKVCQSYRSGRGRYEGLSRLYDYSGACSSAPSSVYTPLACCHSLCTVARHGPYCPGTAGVPHALPLPNHPNWLVRFPEPLPQIMDAADRRRIRVNHSARVAILPCVQDRRYGSPRRFNE